MNRVRIILNKKMTSNIVDVGKKSGRIISVKLVFEEKVLNIISASMCQK